MKHLFEEYKRSLKLLEIEELLDVAFYRPLAFAFVKSIYTTSITPNQITCIAVVCGIVGGSMLSVDTYQAGIVAAILLPLSIVFDCADGMLARLKKNGTPFGRALDGVSDYIVGVTIYISIAIGYAGHEHATALMALTVAAAISNSLHAVLVDYYRLRFVEYSRPQEEDGTAMTAPDAAKRTIPSGILEQFLAILDAKYAKAQRMITKRRTDTQLVRGEEYYRKNKTILRYWTYLGTSTQLTSLVVCAFIHRIDVYLYGVIIVGNLYAIALSIIQSRIDAQLHFHSHIEIAL
ncbi:MAG: CDP-alcohol phosphatidyltransferase family protein [Candidatus Kapaibacterium sp.]